MGAPEVPFLPSRSHTTTILAALFLVPLIAGCIDGDPPSSRFEATGQGGVLFTSWDYPGATQEDLNARLQIDVDEVDNTGTILVGTRRDNESMTIELSEFVHDTDDFHSGGIAANFDEHGDTGVGNALLPRMHLLLATWGPGKIMWGGNATIDPYTGSDVWDAHMMVTSTGVRENGKVEKADGSGPYDPADPGNARIGSDTEAHLVFTSRYANESLAPMNVTLQGETPAEMEQANEYAFDVVIPSGTITARIDLGNDPNEVGRYFFRLVGPDGTVHDTTTISKLPPALATTATLSFEGNQSGTWKIRALGQGAPATFTADVSVIYPPKPMFYFFWEDVDVTQRVVR